MHADDPPVLLKAHDAMDLALDYWADLVITHAALGALKP